VAATSRRPRSLAPAGLPSSRRGGLRRLRGKAATCLRQEIHHRDEDDGHHSDADLRQRDARQIWSSYSQRNACI